MPVSNTPVFSQANNTQATLILNGAGAQTVDNSGVVTGTTLIYTAGANGGRLLTLNISSNDSAARYVSIWHQPGGSGAIGLIGTVAVAATSGLSATGILQNVDFLGNPYVVGLPIDNSGKPCIPLKAGDKLYAGMVVAVTANKAIYIMTYGEDL